MKVSINKGFYFNNIIGKLVEVKKRLFILILLFTGLGIFSCKKKKEPEKVDLGEAYYPAVIGKYVVYDVDSIVYDEFTFDSTHYKYQVKEKVEAEFTDPAGKQAFKLHRYIKKFNAAVSYTAMPWTIKDVWQFNHTGKTLEVVEENIRFVKLIFPVKESSTWNGNATNTLGEMEYKYLFVDQPETINGHNFEKVALIEHKNFPTLISREYFAEKYAKNVGLVYREIIDLKMPGVVSLTVQPINIAQKSGVIYTSRVVSYGTE